MKLNRLVLGLVLACLGAGASLRAQTVAVPVGAGVSAGVSVGVSAGTSIGVSVGAAMSPAAAAGVVAGFFSSQAPDLAALKPVLSYLGTLQPGAPGVQARVEPVARQLRAAAQVYLQQAAAPVAAPAVGAKAASSAAERRLAALSHPLIRAQLTGEQRSGVDAAYRGLSERKRARLEAKLRSLGESWKQAVDAGVAVSAEEAVAVPAGGARAERPSTWGLQPAPAAAAAVPIMPLSVEKNLAIDRDHPALARYLELLAQMHKAWGKPPFENAELERVQREVAAAEGLELMEHPEPVEVSPKGLHRLNRWAAVLRKMGLRLYWSPLHNHYEGYGALYSDKGWIMGDELGPLMRNTSTPLFHEFLHAYVARGKYAAKFAPLRTFFSRSGFEAYPKSEGRPDAGYLHSPFQADEILTNLQTSFDRARKVLAVYAGGKEGWKASSLEDAPADVQTLVKTLDTPIFLSESVREMSTRLLPGVMEFSWLGLQGKAMSKSYGNTNHSIPYVGEVEENEKNDRGFYEFERKDRTSAFSVWFLTVAKLRTIEPDNTRVFPVLFTHNGYTVRVELSLEAVLKVDLNDPKIQDLVVRSAAPEAVMRLAQLQDLTDGLQPSIDRLKGLQARAREHVGLRLVEEIRAAARAAFLQTAFFFIRQPEPAAPNS
ncbi:MAG: hypothetical protein WC969_08265 [Elusimicrobiota bacterium]|jgi:hypothetical protein